MAALVGVLCIALGLWAVRLFNDARARIAAVKRQACIDYELTRDTLLEWYERQGDLELLSTAKIMQTVHDRRCMNTNFLPITKPTSSPLDVEYLLEYQKMLREDEFALTPGNTNTLRHRMALEFSYALVACRDISI